jgi:hypothetical protein
MAKQKKRELTRAERNERLEDESRASAARERAAKATVAPPAPPPPAKNYTDGPTEGKTFPIKVWREGDVYEDYFHGAAKDREVFISGAAYDHVDTTADGVWIYRNDRKN